MIVQPSFRESILTFFRRKFTFLLVFGAVCLAGAGYLLVKTPMYLSGASLVLRFDQQMPDIDRKADRAEHQQEGEASDEGEDQISRNRQLIFSGGFPVLTGVAAH